MKNKKHSESETAFQTSFENKVRKGRDAGGTRTFLRFLNDEEEEMGSLELRSGFWIYFTPSDDPDGSYGWHANELRQIADKLDELDKKESNP